MSSRYLDPFLETLGRDALRQIQLKKFQMMLGSVLESNTFYRQKLAAAGITRAEDICTFEDMRRIPFTTKTELSLDQAGAPPYGTNLTFPLQQYTRIHHTSGTTGEPLKCLDTDESWAWWARCWGTVYRAAGITPLDRVFFAFSFGPFIGFWSAYEGARIVGALAIPGGGMSSAQRVRAILTHDVSALVCTPTYALHMADVAAQEGLDLAASNVRTTIHAGEPGASIPSTKKRIEESWGARCFDHAGATEVGAWGFECQAQAGLHVNEGEFIFEVVDPATGAQAEEGELIMTNLGRSAMPVIRYRTGDRVRVTEEPCACGRTYRRLAGGIVGRVDDVLIVRGVNVFPSVIEDFVRRFPEINEFAVDVFRRDELDEMEIRIETQSPDADAIASAVARDIRNGLSVRPIVRAVPYGSLPRFDLKARRIKDHRR
jgi:phenylacetate-CoA ligase